MNHDHHGHHQVHHEPSTTPDTVIIPDLIGHQDHATVQSHNAHSIPGGHDDHSSHDHALFFNTNLNTSVLFSTWTLDSKTGLFLACLATIIMGVAYQGLKCLRQYIHGNYREVEPSMKSREHLLQTILYGMQFAVSYVLMLVIMTYNAWLFLAALGGLGMGYYVCGWSIGLSISGRSRGTHCRRHVQQTEMIGNGIRVHHISISENHDDDKRHELVPLRDTTETGANWNCDEIRETDILE